MSGTAATTSDPGHESVNTAPAAASVKPSDASQSSSITGSAGDPPVQDSQQQAPKEAKEKRPRPEWERAKNLKEYWKARKTLFTDEERATAWKETAGIVEKYSDEMVDRYNKEIDALLTYAGLFSAIQTAFNIEFYKYNNNSQDSDPVLLALERISAQLSGFAMNQAFVNSTQPPFVVLRDSTTTTPVVALWIIVLNTLWFSSLILSLSAAFIGIMVKQWLTEYKSGVSGTERQTARLRQLRLNSLERWRVKEIVSIIPVLLELASGLFFSGLLVLLWNFNRTMAIAGTVLVGLLAVFALATIILPSVATHCCYLSPPSLALYKLTRPLRKVLWRVRVLLLELAKPCGGRDILGYVDSVYGWYPEDDFRHSHPRVYHICKSLFDVSSHLSWRGMEGALLSRRTEKLDGDMVASAYKTSMDTNYLRSAAVCTTELSHSVMRTCFQAIRLASAAHWGDKYEGEMKSVHPFMWSSAIVALMNASGEDLADTLEAAYGYITPWGEHVRSDARWTRLACIDFVRVVRHWHDDTPPSNCKEIARNLLSSHLPAMMSQTVDRKLNDDLRQHVASTLADRALKGLDGTATDDSDTTLALYALQCIVECVPPPETPDYKHDSPESKAVRSQAVRALEVFSRFLLTPRALVEHFRKPLDDVLHFALRGHGEQAGLMSPKLMQAIISYTEAFYSTRPFVYTFREEYVEGLIRKLAESSGQNGVVAVMEWTLRITESNLSVDAASLPVDDILRRIRHALCSILRCIPPPGCSDCKPDDSVYKDVQERAVCALRMFSRFLHASPSIETTESMRDVFWELAKHWKRVGLISADLTQAIINCLEAHETKYGAFYEDSWYEFIEDLNRKLAESSGQNGAVAVMESTLSRTEAPLAVDATLLTEDDNLARFVHALRCILRCIPPLGTPDSNSDDPAYKTVRERAIHALRTFTDLLSTVESLNHYIVDDVFDVLRKHGERTGLMSAELRQGIVRYREEFQKAHRELPMWWDYYWRKDWFQKLQSELRNSEPVLQNATTSSTASTSQERPTVNVPPAEVKDLGDSGTASV